MSISISENYALQTSENPLKRLQSSWHQIWSFLQEKIFFRKAQNDFYRVLGGHIFFQGLSAAVELNMFNVLAKRGRSTLSELATTLGIEEKPCRILCLTLVASGLLKKRGAYFSNSRAAQLFLTEDSKWKYSECVRWQNHINYRPLFHFLEALRANTNVGLKEIPGEGDTLYKRLSQSPQLESIFQDAMQEISQQSNQLLGRLQEFSSVKRVLDVGGGNGTNLMQLARTHLQLEGAIFDFPTVCKIADQNFLKSDLDQRLCTIQGNVFEDALPVGFDAIIFCHFFTIWSLDQNQRLLEKAFQALPSGGRVFVFNMMQHDDETGPLTAAIGSPYFLTLATGNGMLYTWREYENCMRKAGFSKVRRRRLPRDHGVIIGQKLD